MTAMFPPLLTTTWPEVMRYYGEAITWTPIVATQGHPKRVGWAHRARVPELVPYLGAHARNLDAEDRAERYRARLDGIGIEAIASELHRRHERYGRHPLVVITRQQDRAALVGWLLKETGVMVPEAGGLDELSLISAHASTLQCS